jgi:hypothetical protein
MDNPEQQDEQRQKTKSDKRHEQRAAREQESINENEQTPVMAGVASLPSNNSLGHKGNDDSDQHDAERLKGTVDI